MTMEKFERLKSIGFLFVTRKRRKNPVDKAAVYSDDEYLYENASEDDDDDGDGETHTLARKRAKHSSPGSSQRDRHSNDAWNLYQFD